jgi:pimeloyl-ACP methyl ester carboxylesterase
MANTTGQGATRIRSFLRIFLGMVSYIVCLAPSLQAQHGPVTEIGELRGAEYRIDIPAEWNGVLILFCHGYSPTPGHFSKDTKPDGEWFANRGYAVAQSGYSGGGWAVREGLHDTELLRQYFVEKFGVPKAVYATGYSLGGFLVTALIETHPDHYVGGLALCAPLGSAEWFISRRVFDVRVVFDYYFPGVFPSADKTPDYFSPPNLEEQVSRLLQNNPQKAEALLRFAGVRDSKELTWLVIFFTSILAELDRRTGGNPFDNRNVVYDGEDGGALNRGVHRYAADPAAAEYLRTYYTSSGRLRRPLLAVRNTYDPLVPGWVSNAYLSTLEQAGGSSLFISQLVERPGHCAITADETGRAFIELVKWVGSGARPNFGILPLEADTQSSVAP